MLILGLGYAGQHIAMEALRAGFTVAATVREPAGRAVPPGVALLRFSEAGPAIAEATHLVATAAPEEAGDPVLATHAAAIAGAPALRWAGYFSTTGVYGDRGGGWVDEATPPAPGQERSRRRLVAEQAWAAALGGRVALDLFRTAGIYGPGRSALDEVRSGRARRVIKPGHSFSRIHVEDIARAVVAAATGRHDAGAPRVLHLADDEPAESAAVIGEAARLLGLPPPPAVPFEQAWAAMSPMGRGFWAENRRVSSAATRAALGLGWRYPGYRAGLAAIHRAEQLQQGRL
ncbi:Rossmann-fold NAD(P)-binding domain-containing protein [Roseomonas marmotae]|nr:SDR family NAD(P)-dependent oxidoreductase [Roseomonas marmotae]